MILTAGMLDNIRTFLHVFNTKNKVMKILLKILLPLFLCLPLMSCGSDDDGGGGGNGGTSIEKFDPVAVTKSNSAKVWAHYMPWFETPATNNGKWGMHWTMSTRDPNKTDASGRREIAAHYYPLIGPYASSDTDVLEYHFLLMKYAGIDGILIDWYGTRKINDYEACLKNTEAIVAVLEKVGLDFAIVYEDRTLEEGLDEDSRISQARQDMLYLQNNFFKKKNYVKIDGSPLLLVFGPIVMKAPIDWYRVFAGLSTKPSFFPIYYFLDLVNNEQYTNGAGGYIWVDENEASIKDKYDRRNEYKELIGAGYPGFNDFYKEGGWGEPAGKVVDPENGALLDRLLKLAKDKNMDYLQLITWNDFGEGTMIEPTVEYQYTFLEKIQAYSSVSYKKANLENIYTYYTLKKKFADNKEKQDRLLQAFYYLISLQDTKARNILDELQ